MLDVIGQRVLVGHVDPRRGWVVEAVYAKTLTAGTDYTLDLVLRGTAVTITLDGSVVGSYGYNAAVADGGLGTISKEGTVSVDRARVRTNDRAFTGVQLPPELRVGDSVVTEGTGGTTTVSIGLSLTQAVTSATTVGWRTVNGTAVAGSDFVEVPAGWVTFAAGSTSATILVSVIGDSFYESAESFGVELTNWAALNLADKTGVVTINNDDVASVVTVAATDASGSEPGSEKISFTVTRTTNLNGALTVNLAWGGTASASDYTGGVSTVTLADGVASAVITITPVDDALVELTEMVTLSVAAGTGYVNGTPASATASILDNDKPTVSIQSTASVTEGNTGSKTVTLTVTLSAPTSSTVTVNYATGNGSATAGTDYVAKTGTLTLAAGVTSQTITVTVNGDRTKESNETFTVTLSAPTNATLGNSAATVTIVNDDGAPLLAAAPAGGAGATAELAAAELDAVVQQAKLEWLSANPSADVSGVVFSIGDLEGQMLGVTGVGVVTIDPTAAGWGWSISGGAIDLHTVVLHELGHALGLDHDEDGLMSATLAPGVSHGVADLIRTTQDGLRTIAVGTSLRAQANAIGVPLAAGAIRAMTTSWLRPAWPMALRPQVLRPRRAAVWFAPVTFVVT
jgi:Calx-beta domain/Matrixin